MKSLRMGILLGMVALAAGAFGQSDAQKSFDKMKSLAGTWQGTVSTDMKNDPAADRSKSVV